MSEDELKLAKAPIVEALLDVGCRMPPEFDHASLEATARAVFQDAYPKFQKRFLDQHHIATTVNEPTRFSTERKLDALQFLHTDEKQLVQIRLQGFTFNRLKPYTSLDDYLPEIRRTWEIFVRIAAPIEVVAVHLRYINSFILPLSDRRVELDEYLKQAPKTPEENALILSGFLDRRTAVEQATGNLVNIVLASQGAVSDALSIILDISVQHEEKGDVNDWPWIVDQIRSLRQLKNRIFRNSLTDKCMNLFQ